LKSSWQTSIIEKVGIFVCIVAIGVSNRGVMERFQHLGDNISRVFHEVLHVISNTPSMLLYMSKEEESKEEESEKLHF